jgi:hypothetical protein
MSENGNTKCVKSKSTLNVDEKFIIFRFLEAKNNKIAVSDCLIDKFYYKKPLTKKIISS